MLNTQVIESTTGIKGQTTGDVLKLSVPRKEVRVSLDGFEIVPFMGPHLVGRLRTRQSQRRRSDLQVARRREWCRYHLRDACPQFSGFVAATPASPSPRKRGVAATS